MTKTLTNSQFVTVAGWRRAYTFSTIAGYATKLGKDAKEYRERAIRNGHDLAWTINSGVALVGDKKLGAAILAREAQEFASATVLENGETVEIEGELYQVKVMGERYSDPIHFKLLGTPLRDLLGAF